MKSFFKDQNMPSQSKIYLKPGCIPTDSARFARLVPVNEDVD